MIPEDDDDKIASFIGRGVFNAAQRGFLEISFFFDLNTIETILAVPSVAAKQIFSITKLIKNGVEETAEFAGLIDSNPRDKAPMLYYFTKDWMPGGSMIYKLFNPDSTYKY
jgi:hypothetical protein